jgi:hypothetical protein
VLSNVKVIAVNWTSEVDTELQGRLPAFYGAVVNGPMFDWLSEYSTMGLTGQDGQPGSNQSIGRGSSPDFCVIGRG